MIKTVADVSKLKESHEVECKLAQGHSLKLNDTNLSVIIEMEI